MLDASDLEMAFSAAKLFPSKKSRLLAILRRASCVAAIQLSIKDHLDALTRGLWRHLVSFMDPAIFERQVELAHYWVETGDPTALVIMGMSFRKHPGFPGRIRLYETPVLQ